MNLLERSHIDKAGYENGWENVRESTPERLVMFSALNKAEAHLMPPVTQGGAWQVAFPKGPSVTELTRLPYSLGNLPEKNSIYPLLHFSPSRISIRFFNSTKSSPLLQ